MSTEIVDKWNSMISLQALPYPLPDEWREKLMKIKRGDTAAMKKWESEARAALGVLVTREIIPSRRARGGTVDVLRMVGAKK